MQLIHDRIVLEAKRQIIHSENTIKEIAYDLGFKDRPYFSRFF
jgi:AraC family transcriptional activator of pobA